MANTRAGNVIRVDTSADFSDVRSIKGIKYVGDTNGTAVIKKENTSGNRLWERSGTNQQFDEACIRCNTGIRVEVTNGAVVYLYLSR